MTHAGISRGLKNSPLDCFLCAAAHCPVRFLARDTRKNTPHKLECFLVTRAGIEPTLTA